MRIGQQSSLKSESVAYLLWALGLFGLGGLHRFYLNRPGSAVLYLLTLDLMLVGLILDFREIPAMVNDANRMLLPAAVPALAPQVVVQEVIKEVVKIRCAYCGQLTLQGKPKCEECGARL